MRRHDHFGDREHSGHVRCLQRPAAAEGHQRKVTRVQPLLHGARADRVRHIGVDDRHDPLGGSQPVHAQPLRQPVHRPPRRRQHSAPSRRPGNSPGPAGPAPRWRRSLSARSRRGHRQPARASRPADRGPTLNAPPLSRWAIDPPPAPIVWMSIIGTISGKPGDPGIARGRLGEPALDHDPDIGRGPAHIERDQRPSAPTARQSTPRPKRPLPGPLSSVTTGFSETIAAVATPPFDAMTCRSARSPAPASSPSSRLT